MYTPTPHTHTTHYRCPESPKLVKKTPLYAIDETITGFVNPPGIADLYMGSTVIDEKFCMAISGRKGVLLQLAKSALLAPDRPN